jgi:hypothetical protein
VTRVVLVTRHPADCADLESLLRPAGITVRPTRCCAEDADDPAGWRAIRRLLSDPPLGRGWSSPRRAPGAGPAGPHPFGRRLSIGRSPRSAGRQRRPRRGSGSTGLVGRGSGSASPRVDRAARPHDRWCSLAAPTGGWSCRRRWPRRAVYPVVVYAMKPTPTAAAPARPGLAAGPDLAASG